MLPEWAMIGEAEQSRKLDDTDCIVKWTKAVSRLIYSDYADVIRERRLRLA